MDMNGSAFGKRNRLFPEGERRLPRGWQFGGKRTMETAVFSGGPNSEKEEEPFSIAFSSALRVAQGQH